LFDQLLELAGRIFTIGVHLRHVRRRAAQHAKRDEAQTFHHDVHAARRIAYARVGVGFAADRVQRFESDVFGLDRALRKPPASAAWR
jgi:hypothetical protein